MSEQITTQNLRLFKRIKEQRICQTNVSHAHAFILNSTKDCKHVILENEFPFWSLFRETCSLNGCCVLLAFICWAFVNTQMLELQQAKKSLLRF